MQYDKISPRLATTKLRALRRTADRDCDFMLPIYLGKPEGPEFGSLQMMSHARSWGHVVECMHEESPEYSVCDTRKSVGCVVVEVSRDRRSKNWTSSAQCFFGQITMIQFRPGPSAETASSHPFNVGCIRFIV
ncbi:hypothetical protein BaRGS_00017180, partial [Batillaria attramentaria]